MIQVTVLYPYTEDARFDWAYYAEQHMPMVQEKLGSALKGWSAHKGVSGGRPGSPPAFIAMGHLVFDSVADFTASFGPNARAIGADMANYTDITPSTQISEPLAQHAC